jgi:hypothetical protein
MQHPLRLHMDQPADYTIQVQGRLGEHWLAAFAPMTLTVESEDPIVSTLRGPVMDQAALHGLLRTLYSLGLPILLVRWENRVGPPTPNPGGDKRLLPRSWGPGG